MRYSVDWTVKFSRGVKKALKKGTRNFSVDVLDSKEGLFLELEKMGPTRFNRPNYGKLKGKGDRRHCHIFRRRPTYVACWEVKDLEEKTIEVYYVGTHEKAPY